MRIQLSDRFGYGRMLRFVAPSVVMMIFTSIYNVVDGFFVSNFVGKVPFAAINLMMPLFIFMMALGFMLGTGGSAIVAQTLGEGKKELANRYFSLLIYATLAAGTFITVLGLLGLERIAVWLGARGEMLDNCILYGRVILPSMPLFLVQSAFQSFFVTAEKPKLGLAFTVAAGVANIVLDALFVMVFRWGLVGAAAATTASVAVGGLGPLVYFARRNDSLLRLGGTEVMAGVLIQSCVNGSSELMSTLSGSVVTVLYNHQLMNLAGDDGVAAFGVIMYLSFIFTAVFMGYSVGIAPVIGYHYGAGNVLELQSLFRKGLTLIAAAGTAMLCVSLLASGPLTGIFVGYDPALREMTLRGMRIYGLSFLFCGFNIFGSAFFTALRDGITSAVISFLRTLVFESSSVMLVPLVFGLDGVWGSVIAAELLALGVTALSFAMKKKRYGYV